MPSSWNGHATCYSPVSPSQNIHDIEYRMNLITAFSDSVQKHANKTALFWGEREYDYAELWSQSLVVAEHLKQLGVQSGDRVGLWLKNCPEFIPSLFGIWQAGGVAVPINNFLKPDEVNYILADAGIDVVITDAELAAHFPALQAANPELVLFSVEKLKAAATGKPSTFNFQPSTPQTPPSALAVLIYTSGTTGRPKGAMLSHANLLHNVESCRIVLKAVEADRLALLLPMFHSYMLTVGILLPLLIGGSIVLVKSLHPPKTVLQEIFQRQATILPAIPQFYRSMTHAPIQPPIPLRMCKIGRE